MYQVMERTAIEFHAFVSLRSWKDLQFVDVGVG